MHSNFRQQRRNPRLAVDGFLNAPSRQQLTSRPDLRRAQQGKDEFRTSSRTIGDFKRSEGYHVANTQVSMQQPAATRKAEGASMLHTTLPGARGRAKKAPTLAPAGKRDWRKIRTWSLRGGLAVLGVLVLLGGFLFAKGFFKVNKVFKGGGSAAALEANVNPSLLKGEGDGRVNILLLGRGGDGHAGADLTDTILLASIDPVNKRAALVSIPRDLWVTTDKGSSKINAVYAAHKNAVLNKSGSNKAAAQEAGIKAVEDTVEDVLGVPVHYYTMVDFTAFKQAVDTVGGVTMDVPAELAVQERMWDPSVGKPYYLNVPAGRQQFDGTRALFFTRTRHTSARGDFDRSERQRLFIAALSQKVLSAGTYTNPVKISQLIDAFGDHVSTDLSVNDAMRLMDIGKEIGGNFDSVGLAGPPANLVTTGNIDGQSIVKPVAGLGEYDDIKAYIRNKLKDGYILKENANITILNGTVTPGLAGEKADELKSYGYNIGTVADAPTQAYRQTVIVDLTKGKKPYTKNYLEKRFDVKVVTKLPDQTIQPGKASFVIILGNNETLDR